MKILAAITTYNRVKLLERCLNSLEIQTLKIDNILVVDNSSTDNTQSLLIKRNIAFIKNENFGSASGWHTSINYALEKEYDYIWLMDDDGYPDKDALKNLVDQLNNFKNIACISSAIVDERNKNQFIFPYPRLNKYGEPKIFSTKRKYYFLNEIYNMNIGIYPYAQLFNGSLISIKSIKKIGNIDKNYFIFGEEVDYFWRMKKVGKVLTCFNAKHYHPNVNNRPYTYIKIYYFIKNSIFNNNKHLNNKLIRNLLVLVIIFVRVTKRNGLFLSLGLFFGRKNFLFYKAIIRGLKKRIKIDHYEFI